MHGRIAVFIPACNEERPIGTAVLLALSVYFWAMI